MILAIYDGTGISSHPGSWPGGWDTRQEKFSDKMKPEARHRQLPRKCLTKLSGILRGPYNQDPSALNDKPSKVVGLR